MKYANLSFSKMPRIMYAHQCTIGDIRGQARTNCYFEITVVEQGEMVIKSETLGYHTIGSGQYFFAPEGIGYETIVNKSLKHSCVAFFLESDLKLVGEEDFVFEKRNNKVIVKLENLYIPITGRVSDVSLTTLMQKIIREQISPTREYSNLICSSAIIEILINLSYRIPQGIELPCERYYCEKIFAYITENFSNSSLDMSAIAAHIGLHPNYISLIFKKITGNTIMSCVKKIRLDEAKRLLSLNKYLIKDISKMVGFEDSNYFSVAFKNSEGVSPENFSDKKGVLK